jgi:hypothetical protein
MFSAFVDGENSLVGIAANDGLVGVVPLVTSLTHWSSLTTLSEVVTG